MNEIIIVALGMAACFLAAGFPVLMSPTLRPKLQALCGSLCVLLGAGGFSLLCSGAVLAAAPAEKPTDVTPAAEAKSVADSSAASNAAPSEGKPPSATEDQPLNAPPAVEPEPATQVVIPPGRPDWVESLPARTGQVHTTAVSSGPYARPLDAQLALNEELVKRTNEYIAEYLGSDYAHQFIRYDALHIKTALVKPKNMYSEQIVVSIGPMHQVHALLEFGPEFRADLDRQWARVIGASRLAQTGLLAAAVLGLLGTVFGYFRLDNATRGYYTGRLQAMAAIAILALAGFGVYFARLIPWL